MRIIIYVLKEIGKDILGLFRWDNLKTIIWVAVTSLVAAGIIFIASIGIGYMLCLILPQPKCPFLEIGISAIVLGLAIYLIVVKVFKSSIGYVKTKVRKAKNFERRKSSDKRRI